jgi:hypothetical protein
VHPCVLRKQTRSDERRYEHGHKYKGVIVECWLEHCVGTQCRCFPLSFAAALETATHFCSALTTRLRVTTVRECCDDCRGETLTKAKRIALLLPQKCSLTPKAVPSFFFRSVKYAQGWVSSWPQRARSSERGFSPLLSDSFNKWLYCQCHYWSRGFLHKTCLFWICRIALLWLHSLNAKLPFRLLVALLYHRFLFTSNVAASECVNVWNFVCSIPFTCLRLSWYFSVYRLQCYYPFCPRLRLLPFGILTLAFCNVFISCLPIHVSLQKLTAEREAALIPFFLFTFRERAANVGLWIITEEARLAHLHANNEN